MKSGTMSIKAILFTMSMFPSLLFAEIITNVEAPSVEVSAVTVEPAKEMVQDKQELEARKELLEKWQSSKIDQANRTNLEQVSLNYEEVNLDGIKKWINLDLAIRD
jgi:hypothetical protein